MNKLKRWAIPSSYVAGESLDGNYVLFDDAKKEIEEHNTHMLNMGDTIEQLEKELEAAKAEIIELKKSYGEKWNEAQELNAEISAYKETDEQYNSELSNAINQLGEAKAEIERLKILCLKLHKDLIQRGTSGGGETRINVDPELWRELMLVNEIGSNEVKS